MTRFTEEQSAFFDEVLEAVRLIPIQDIIHDVYENPEGWCPFHNDRHAGSFSIMKKTNRYRCFSCSANGDGIDFVQKREKISFINAVLKLALQFSILTPSQIQAFKLGKVGDKEVKEPPKTVEGLLDDDDTETIAPPDVLHQVFSLFAKGNSIFKNASKLSKQHYEYLKTERKLNDDAIEQVGYFTMPSRNKKYMDIFLKELQSIGLNKEVLNDIPGFFDLITNEGEKKKTFVGHSGIGIPIKDEQRRIVGIQVRRDHTEEKNMRYVWFSSSFANRTEREDMINGTGSRSPMHVSYPKSLKNPHDIFLTEGVFKSEELARTYKGVAISIQGIQSWKGQIERFIDYMEEEKAQPIYRLHFFFDSDISENIHVYLATRDMYQTLREKYPNVGFMHYWWNDLFGKGIDDVINAGHTNKVLHLDSKTFITAYDKMIHELEESTGESIWELEKDWVKEEFDEQIAGLFQKKR